MLIKTKRNGTWIALALTFCLLANCVTQVQSAKRKPIYDTTSEMYEIPKKHEKKQWPKGTVVPLEKDKPAPFAGILLSEKRAKDAAQLRIAYEELYGAASVNKKLAKTVLKVADKQLADADETIKKLRDANNSWWSRNKFTVGLVLGILTTALTGGLLYWGASEIQNKQ